MFNIHRVIIHCIPLYNFHFYKQKLFVLLSVSYNLQGCKITQRQHKAGITLMGEHLTESLTILS